MKLHASMPTGVNLFTGYGPDYLEINKERHTCNLIVTPETLLSPWARDGFPPPNTALSLSEADLEPLFSLPCEMVLLGTGTRFQFPAPRLLAYIHQHGIGVEVMDTHAACRTYNILIAEGRKVAAALIRTGE